VYVFIAVGEVKLTLSLNVKDVWYKKRFKIKYYVLDEILTAKISKQCV